MRHYKKTDGSVWAFEPDGSQDDLITEDMRPISDSELAELRAPKFGQLAALQRLRLVRAPILDALAGLLADALVDGDATAAQALRVARQGLKDLPAFPALLAATSDAQFDYIAHERYKELAAALPSTARTAFRDALL